MQTITSKMNSPDNESWRPPSELSGSLPRSVRFSGKGVFLMCIVALLAGGAVFLPVWIYQQTAKELELARLFAAHANSLTNGVVTNVGPVTSDDEQHKVTYRYEVRGRSYEGSVRLSGRNVKRLQEQPAIVVRYLPDSPERSQIVGYEHRPPPAWLPLFIAGSMVFPIALLSLQLKRQRYLLAEGRTARGVVTGRRWVQSEGARHTSMRYEFTTPAGGTQKGGFPGSPRRFPEGTVITVLYDPDNPRRNARYPLEFVRIAEW